MRTPHNVKTRQHGAVLVVSLLILLVLTLIGINSLDGSIMEEKMASNSQTATTTFQKAESSIREAFNEELANPFGAVTADRTNAPHVDRSDTVTVDDITTTIIASTSQHKYDPDIKATTMTDSSDNLFEPRPFEIIGEAWVGGMRSTNTQGYLVLNAMRQP